MKAPKAQATYEAALEAERLRERQWRRTRQGAFESSFVSFDANTECYYPLAAVISSKKCKEEPDLEKRRRAYKTAHDRVRRNAPHCLKVFNLIIKNGKDRQKSICELVHEALDGRSSTRHKEASTTSTSMSS